MMQKQVVLPAYFIAIVVSQLPPLKEVAACKSEKHR
jgi:hypothetical protein